MSDILDRVQVIVARVAGDRAPAKASPDTPLDDQGYGLDSVDVLELLLACEEEFGVRLDEDLDLAADALRSSRSLADLIRKKAG
jgi:acyl carrier protein